MPPSIVYSFVSPEALAFPEGSRQLQTPHSNAILFDDRRRIPDTECALFRIPRELRDMIYGYIGFGGCALHARYYRRNHGNRIRYYECQAEYTAKELYDMSREGACPQNPLRWRHATLNSPSPIGICAPNCGSRHPAASLLPVSRQFWSECREQHFQSTIVFASAKELSDFIWLRNVTRPELVRRLVFNIPDGISTYPGGWAKVVDRSNMIKFEALRDVTIVLVVHEFFDRYRPNGMENRPRNPEGPGDVGVLFRSLGSCFWGTQWLLQALQVIPSLKANNVRLVVQQRPHSKTGLPSLPIAYRIYAHDCVQNAVRGEAPSTIPVTLSGSAAIMDFAAVTAKGIRHSKRRCIRVARLID